ncbi:phage protein Gp27 family protein [Treponema pedis]|uniref:phage protein Gp27 family protein n=1 Tax=Treponema pedis TaxID=409322 RepID=UPI003141F899
MGVKSKAEQNGLVELIIDKWDGGKNTIVYVTEEVNKKIQELGLKVTISREGIRRVIKTHKEEIEDTQKAIEAAKAMAEVLKDYPGTEMSEAVLMQMTTLIAKDLRTIDSLEFDDPEKLITSAARVSEAQLKLSNYRTKAIKALEKAKEEIKKELQNAIKNDSELLERLYVIVDKAQVK